MDDTAEHGKPDEGGKMNKQNETVLLEHLADTFETKLRKADRSIGTDIPDPYRGGTDGRVRMCGHLLPPIG